MNEESAKRQGRAGRRGRRRAAGAGGDRLPLKAPGAIAALCRGATVSQAAALAGVHRNTVHRWLRDEQFCAVLARMRAKWQQSLRDRLEALAEEALRVLERSLRRRRRAIKLLEKLGYLQKTDS